MTTYELYINDILCDLSSDEVVTLLYQSPIFSSLDSIQSNRSYNIGLPPTPTNMQAIGQAARPDVDADAPYVRLPAALYQDGVPLFTQGFAVVTDIADTINVTLTWGNADNFQPLFDSNLRDLGPQLEEAGDGHIEWNENTTILEKSTPPSGALPIYPSVAFWGIDFGMGLSNPKYLHPAIDVWRILNAIQQAHEITIEDYQRLYGSLELSPIIPLVSKNGDNKINPAFYSDNMEIIDPRIGSVKLNGRDQANIVSGTSDIDVSEMSAVRIKMTGNDGDSIRIYAPGTAVGNAAVRLYVFGFDNDTMTGRPIYSQGASVSDGYANLSAFDETVDVKDYDHIYIQISPEPGLSVQAIYAVFEVWGDYPNLTVIFPDKFPIAPNLPDMSQGDFILALMSMNGLFAYADKNSPNTIKLISIDDIIANVQNNDIIDWSDRIILNDTHRVDMPDASAFTIDDLAQSNILDYDNDDDVKTDTHGTITIRNENIEKETELVELPFSASENITTSGVNCALIPIYEDDGKGGANYSECSPRILAWKDDQTYNSSAICTGRFDPWMKFGGEEGIVKARYASYQKVVDRLRLITVRAKLTALDLYNLDYTKPVYIAQFGQIFAIYSVETGEYGICDCQLLKLKVDGVVPVHYYLLIGGNSSDFSIDAVAAGAEFAYSVETNGTPYIVSYDSRLTVSLNSEADTWELSIYVPENTSDAGIDYNPVILGISEDVSVRRRIIISQQGKEYYLTLNGSIDDISLDTNAAAGRLRVAYSTNGTPEYSISVPDDVMDAEIDATYINIYTTANTSSEQRAGTVTVYLNEAPSIARKIVVIQSGFTTYHPSVTFSQTLPWDSESALLSMTNNGDVDLQVISIPDWFLYTAVPHDLAQGEDFAFGISQNTTGELRSGTVGMRYQDSIGQYVDYNVEVSQKWTNARMVIIDASIEPSLAGQNVIASFEVIGDGATGEGSVQIANNNTISLTFEQVSSYLGIEGLEYCDGDTLYVMLTDEGFSGDATIPETGDIHIVLK